MINGVLRSAGGGKVVVGVLGTTLKKPPAAWLAHDHSRSRETDANRPGIRMYVHSRFLPSTILATSECSAQVAADRCYHDMPASQRYFARFRICCCGRKLRHAMQCALRVAQAARRNSPSAPIGSQLQVLPADHPRPLKPTAHWGRIFKQKSLSLEFGKSILLCSRPSRARLMHHLQTQDCHHDRRTAACTAGLHSVLIYLSGTCSIYTQRPRSKPLAYMKASLMSLIANAPSMGSLFLLGIATLILRRVYIVVNALLVSGWLASFVCAVLFTA